MEFKLSVERSISRIAPEEWDLCASSQPFLRHSFFEALEKSHSVGDARYAIPQYIVLRDPSGRLAACVPAMLKVGNLTEYGPECLWLDEGLKTGCFAWPKFQVGIPLYPVCGPRLLVRPDLSEKNLPATMIDALKLLGAKRYQVSAMNIMHIDQELAIDLRHHGWLISRELHGKWQNPGCGDFAEYLAWLPNRKRYLINKERRLTDKLGLDIRTLTGHEISNTLLERYYNGHEKVCLRYGNRTWLPLAMFRELIESMPESIRLIAAFDGDEYIAGAFCLVDRDVLYVRTWSAIHEIPRLCFELICYRPIIYALENGLKKIDSGLNGPHKIQRGFLDKPVYSAHWFYNEQLRGLARQVLSHPDEQVNFEEPSTGTPALQIEALPA